MCQTCLLYLASFFQHGCSIGTVRSCHNYGLFLEMGYVYAIALLRHFPRFCRQSHISVTSLDVPDRLYPLTRIGCEKNSEKGLEVLQKACDDGFGASCAVLRQRAAQLAQQNASEQSEKTNNNVNKQ